MQQADVVLYERLLAPGDPRSGAPRCRAHLRRQAPQPAIRCRRTRSIPSWCALAKRRRKRVLRLKGGDPFIFGRGGEEIEILAAARHPVPGSCLGITAASGCAAYAGIPLTHRDQRPVLCLRHRTCRARMASCTLNWEQLAQRGQTVVIYMGPAHLAAHCANSSSPAWPAGGPAGGAGGGRHLAEATRPCWQPWRSAAISANRPGCSGASLVIVGEAAAVARTPGLVHRAAHASSGLERHPIQVRFSAAGREYLSWDIEAAPSATARSTGGDAMRTISKGMGSARLACGLAVAAVMLLGSTTAQARLWQHERATRQFDPMARRRRSTIAVAGPNGGGGSPALGVWRRAQTAAPAPFTRAGWWDLQAAELGSPPASKPTARAIASPAARAASLVPQTERTGKPPPWSIRTPTAAAPSITSAR